MRPLLVTVASLSLAGLLLTGCARSAHQTGQEIFDEVLPRELRSQVDTDLRFSELRASPEQHQGKVVMLSGIVLEAKRKRDRTEVEILQLPTEPGEAPAGDRSRSEGRFLAVKEDVDPATFETGHPITIIGQVEGRAVKMLDEAEYVYPVLEIKHVVDWQKMAPRYGGYYGGYPYYSPFYRGFYGSPYGPFYGPFGYYPYWGGFGGFGAFGFRGGGSPSLPPSTQTFPRTRRSDE